MNIKLIAPLLVALLTAPLSVSANPECHDMLDFSATKLRSKQQINFCEQFAGKAMLIVNTASECGYTPQFKDLEALHQRYGEQLAVVGFPSNDFNQEHADSEKIADVCYLNYGVTFTMLEPTQVKGEGANTLFRKLTERTGEAPAWNFTKYLISADGGEVTHFASKIEPGSDEFTTAVDALLTDAD